jgi:high-affinity iron transporter
MITPKLLPNRLAPARWLTLIFWFIGFGAMPLVQAQDQEAAVTWRLLDYIAVDYAGAVRDGQVISDAEYAEMQEFSRTVAEKLAALPAKPERAALIHDADELDRLVVQRAAPETVAKAARTLGAQLIAAYPVPLAPAQAPNLARGAELYQSMCASCHGATGAGDGPAAANLDPAPVNFLDETRARERSLFALYQVIAQGLEGTAMVSYASLPDEDRWALAFHVGGLAYPVASGQPVADEHRPGDLRQLVQSIPSALAAQVGEDRARDITAAARHRPPAAPTNVSGEQWTIVRARLSDAIAAHRRGDRSAARAAALSAYLDGFEPLEPLLAARQPSLLREVEQAMLALRAGIEREASVEEVQSLADEVSSLVDRAEAALAPHEGSDWSTFLGALTILVREGLEALLIVIAMVAFLRKAQRQDVLRYVHAGWVGALLAGVATWGVATYAVAISGAQREVIEGLSALLAAVVLVCVGLWLHQKSFAGRWQQYLKEKLSHALTQQSAWVLFGLSFIAVYREVFETILFYTAMWNEQGDNHAVVGGFLTGSLILAGVTIAILRFSRRLPIGQFFSLSSLLMAVLAVVLTGKGVAALQEAGWITVAPIAMPRLDWLGIYPSWQTMIAQAAALLVLVVGYRWNRRAAAIVGSGKPQ